jgi:hypothetical protein
MMHTTEERKWGKLIVYLRVNKTDQLIFAKNKQASFIGKPLHKQAQGLAEAFAKELNKTESRKEF